MNDHRKCKELCSSNDEVSETDILRSALSLPKTAVLDEYLQKVMLNSEFL